MPALTANTVVTQILKETESVLVVRLMMHQGATTPADESSVLKVNAETLLARTIQLRLTSVNPLFVPGELVTGNNSGATGYVAPIGADIANTITVTETTGTFNTSDFLNRTQGSPAGLPTQSVGVNLVTVPPRSLEILSLEWTITGGSNASTTWGKVGIEFANSSASFTAAMLTESGYMGRSQLGQKRLAPPSSLTSPDGNIYISTYDMAFKNAGYNIVMELRKTQGFAQRPVY